MAKELIRPPLNGNEWQRQVSKAINNIVGTVQDDSTASDVAGLKADFNALLAWLRAIATD